MLAGLSAKYAAQGLSILAFPCNQFGSQAPGTADEYLATLEYVRPGGGYVAPFPHFARVSVNGAARDPFWTALLTQCPTNPTGTIQTAGYPAPPWSPITIGDVAWNFEKFLIGRDGVPTTRYSNDSEEFDLQAEIENLLAQSA
jgi:glutathione peroxidase